MCTLEELRTRRQFLKKAYGGREGFGLLTRECDGGVDELHGCGCGRVDMLRIRDEVDSERMEDKG